MSYNDSSFTQPKPASCTLGTCTLVGAGPGDPELLTLKAVKAIQAATVLFVDDLVNDEVLIHASPSARIVHVGKRGGICTSDCASNLFKVKAARCAPECEEKGCGQRKGEEC